MKAVILDDTRKLVVRDVPDAEMRETPDALLRITSSAICGTYSHFYEGRMPVIEGGSIGHRLRLETAVDACARFDSRVDSYIKVVLKP